MNRWRIKLRQQTYLWMMVIVFGLSVAAVSAGEQPALMTEDDKMSYITGVDIVRTLIRQGGQLNIDLVIQGIMDGVTGEKLLVTEKELQKTLTALQTERKQRQACQAGEFAVTRIAGGDEDAPAARFLDLVCRGVDRALEPRVGRLGLGGDGDVGAGIDARATDRST